MKIARFSSNQNIFYGILENKLLKAITCTSDSLYYGSILPDLLEGKYQLTGDTFSLEEVKLLPPSAPSKVLCLGLNYRNHAEEFKLPVPEKPILFMKPSTTVIGDQDYILYPPQSNHVDYEAELGVVIGKECYRVKAKNALSYVIGYTCTNDITARDFQPKQGQWTYAKGFDTFAPMGPWMETEINDPENLEIKGYLNGSLVQHDHTREHIFSVDYLIEYISHCMTLLPGDVIMTGTPSGVGPLRPGDTFEVVINAIGKMENKVKYTIPNPCR